MNAVTRQKHPYEIWDRIKRAQNGLMSSRNYEHLQFDYSVLLIGWWSLILAMFLDTKLLFPNFGDPPSAKYCGTAFLALLPVCMLNGWIVSHQIALQTPRDGQRHLWVRLLRWTLASILPASSLATPAIWRRLQEISWTQSNRQAVPCLDLRRPFRQLPSSSLVFRLFESTLRQFLETLSILAPFAAAGVIWNSNPEETFIWTLSLSVLTHAVAFAAAPVLAKPLLRRSQGSAWHHVVQYFRWLTLLPALWVLPLGIVLLYRLDLDRLLVHSAYTDRNQSRRQASWRKLESTLQQTPQAVPIKTFWSLPKMIRTADDFGRIAEERRVLFRFKAAFLVPEAGILLWFGATYTEIFSTHDKVLVPIFIGAFALVITSLCLWFLPSLAYSLRQTRAAEAAMPYLRGGYLLLPAAAFLAGCGGGILVARGVVREISLYLQLGVLLLALLLLLRFLEQFNRSLSLDNFDSLWCLSGMLIALETFVIMLPTSVEGTGLHLALSAPFLGLLTGIVCSPSLLYPFNKDLLTSRLPLRFRAVLWTMAATALLPLGGLAVPFWIWARQRLWQKYEHFGEKG